MKHINPNPILQQKVGVVVLLFCMLFAACSNLVQKPYDPPVYDFKAAFEQLDSLNPEVEKTYTSKGKTETIITHLKWQKELAIYSDLDLRTSKIENNYSKTESEEGNLKIVNYISHDPNLAAQIVQLSYTDNKVDLIYIYRKTFNRVSNSIEELYFYPNKSFYISASHKLKKITELEFKISGKILGNTRSTAQLWYAKLELGKEQLPFQFSIHTNHIEIHNADERIKVTEFSKTKDSLTFKLPVFESEIKARFVDSTHLDGVWYNYSKSLDKEYSNYHTPFSATTQKTEKKSTQFSNFNGTWEIVFSEGIKDDEYPAIGVFKQRGNKLTGTFLTETGDYRYLNGFVNGNKMQLSCFDGAHAFLFKGTLSEENKLNGIFWSGNHWEEPFEGFKNGNAKLTPPEELTYLKEGYDKIEFSFPNLQGKKVSLEDDKFKGKVVVVQIMGSWCPNCKDETKYLIKTYKKYQPKGLEIVALAFERTLDFNRSLKSLIRFKNQLGVNYEILVAGEADKEATAKTLPMLNHILSYPTTIFIDKKGNIRKIFTGFYGPSTGKYYHRFTEQTELFVEQLLEES